MRLSAVRFPEAARWRPRICGILVNSPLLDTSECHRRTEGSGRSVRISGAGWGRIGAFRLDELIREVQRVDPARGRGTIQPTEQA